MFDLLDDHQKRTKRFCTAACRQSSNQRRRYIVAENPPKECLWCAAVFKPRGTGQLYCSKRCRMDVKNDRRRVTHQPEQPEKPATRSQRKTLDAPRVGSNEWAEEQLRRLR